MAVLSCRETHNSIAAECVTDLFATTLYSAILGYKKSNIISYAERGSYRDIEEYDKFWTENVDQLVNRWRNKNDGENLKDLGGYIVDAFTIGMWGFVNSDTFEDGMKKYFASVETLIQMAPYMDKWPEHTMAIVQFQMNGRIRFIYPKNW